MNIQIEKMRAAFRWRTQDGFILAFSQMTTQHIFYALRMVIRSLPETIKNQKTRLERIIALFYFEIENRGDLDAPYKKEYQDLLDSLPFLGEVRWYDDKGNEWYHTFDATALGHEWRIAKDRIRPKQKMPTERQKREAQLTCLGKRRLIL